MLSCTSFDSKWKKARKKPVIVHYREVEKGGETIKTREGELKAYPDEDFIICGVEMEVYPIKKEIFYKTYELCPTEKGSFKEDTT